MSTSIAPSSPPIDVVIDDISPYNFTINWEPPPPDTHNGIIRQYTLNVTESETGEIHIYHTPETYYVLSHLHPSYTYIFAVSAVTVSPGPPTESMNVTTLEACKYKSNCETYMALCDREPK